MPFPVVHPRDFELRFGIKQPSRATLKRWRDAYGFPRSLDIPKGYYRFDAVARWFESRAECRQAA